MTVLGGGLSKFDPKTRTRCDFKNWCVAFNWVSRLSALRNRCVRIKQRTHLSNTRRLPNGFVKSCLPSTHGECEQTNRHTAIGAEQTSFGIRSVYRHPRELYRMRMKAFAVARSLLLYHPHIGKWMHLFVIHSAFVCRSFGIRLSFIRHSFGIYVCGFTGIFGSDPVNRIFCHLFYTDSYRWPHHLVPLLFVLFTHR